MQDSPRLYIPQSKTCFSNGMILDMDSGQAHYLGNVLRRSAGDEVRVFNPSDGEWLGRIVRLRKSQCVIELASCLRSGMTAGKHTGNGPVLVFALLKRDATDTVIRMGTELGVSCFQPVITERTNAHRVNISRLEAIATEAAEQCERLDVPEISEVAALTDCLLRWPSLCPLFVGVERSDGALPKIVKPPFGFLVGPEGGFSSKEMSIMDKSPFMRAVSLGATVLRADTAAVAGLSALSALARQE